MIAGRSVERLAALSDGAFAIALTLLVLDLRVPVSASIHTELVLWHTLVELLPHFVPCFLSFTTLGIFWIAQQTQLNDFVRSDRTLTWIHLGFLLAVSLLSFSTGLDNLYEIQFPTLPASVHSPSSFENNQKPPEPTFQSNCCPA